MRPSRARTLKFLSARFVANVRVLFGYLLDGECRAAVRSQQRAINVPAGSLSVIGAPLGRGVSWPPYARVSKGRGRRGRWTARLHLRRGRRVDCPPVWGWWLRLGGPA